MPDNKNTYKKDRNSPGSSKKQTPVTTGKYVQKDIPRTTTQNNQKIEIKNLPKPTKPDRKNFRLPPDEIKK